MCGAQTWGAPLSRILMDSSWRERLYQSLRPLGRKTGISLNKQLPGPEGGWHRPGVSRPFPWPHPAVKGWNPPSSINLSGQGGSGERCPSRGLVPEGWDVAPGSLRPDSNPAVPRWAPRHAHWREAVSGRAALAGRGSRGRRPRRAAAAPVGRAGFSPAGGGLGCWRLPRPAPASGPQPSAQSAHGPGPSAPPGTPAG